MGLGPTPRPGAWRVRPTHGLHMYVVTCVSLLGVGAGDPRKQWHGPRRCAPMQLQLPCCHASGAAALCCSSLLLPGEPVQRRTPRTHPALPFHPPTANCACAPAPCSTATPLKPALSSAATVPGTSDTRRSPTADSLGTPAGGGWGGGGGQRVGRLHRQRHRGWWRLAVAQSAHRAGRRL